MCGQMACSKVVVSLVLWTCQFLTLDPEPESS